MAELFFIPYGAAAVASEDRFAPRFVVGNVPAGDSAVPQVTSFTYVPDAGDGVGLAAALAAAGPGGSVYVRRGTYEPDDTLVVPAECVVTGEGRSTIIALSGAGLSNVLFDLGVGASLSQMSVAGLGLGIDNASLVYLRERTALRSVLVDLRGADNTMQRGGVFVATAGGQPGVSVTILDDVQILLDVGTSSVVPADWICGVRGDGGADHVVSMSNVRASGGDAGAATTGVELEFDGCIFEDNGMLGFYASGGAIRASGRPTRVMSSLGTEIYGCQLINSAFVLDGVLFGPATVPEVPGIYVSGGAGVATANITNCQLEEYDPPMIIGDALELTEDVRVSNNRMTTQSGVVPIAIGAGADNTNVHGNVTRGGNGERPTNLGTGTNIGTNNIWGA